jgi:flagellar biosynthesis protein
MSMKKTPKAVALKYDRNTHAAPRVTAKGRGHLADRIQQVARESGVPIMTDENLVQVLEALELDLEIPPELYRAVAEVLVFVYRLNGTIET